MGSTRTPPPRIKGPAVRCSPLRSKRLKFLGLLHLIIWSDHSVSAIRDAHVKTGLSGSLSPEAGGQEERSVVRLWSCPALYDLRIQSFYTESGSSWSGPWSGFYTELVNTFQVRLISVPSAGPSDARSVRPARGARDQGTEWDWTHMETLSVCMIPKAQKGADPFAVVLTLTTRVKWTEPTCSSWFGSRVASGEQKHLWLHQSDSLSMFTSEKGPLGVHLAPSGFRCCAKLFFTNPFGERNESCSQRYSMFA